MVELPPVRLPNQQRTFAGGIISFIGVALLGIPVYDLWDDYANLNWALVTTLIENATFLLLATTLVLGGIWLVRTDWHTRHVTQVSKWTVGGFLAATLLFSWVVFIQLWAMGRLKPYVIAMDGILIGTTVTFGVGLLSAKTNIQQSQLQGERQAKQSLESLHETGIAFHEAETPDEAYEIGLDAIGTLLSPTVVRIFVADELVAERTYKQHQDENIQQSASVSIGDRGYITFFDGEIQADERTTLELLGTHLDRALDRLDRDQELREEREQFALINRTLRHDLLNDLQVVNARLQIVEKQADLPDDHWDVITQRLGEMEQFVEEMHDYMNLVEQDEHEFEPVSLRPTLEKQVALVQNAHENATLSVEELPDVNVLADELLGHVFGNLLRNAVEHNDKDAPKVHVNAERTSDTVTVTIADNGPGIPDDHKEVIRKRGIQADESTGSGFGLHMVTEAVNAYDGDLEIQDNEPEGTKVQVTLPTV